MLTLLALRLDALEAELKEYVALTDAPIVRISAKGNTCEDHSMSVIVL